MKILKYCDELKGDWDCFNMNSKMPLFMFNRDYMEYHKDRFNDNSLLFYDDKDELLAILPATVQDGILTSHGGLTYGGFILSNSVKQHTVNDLFSELIKYAKKNEIKKIIYKTIPHIYHMQGAEEDFYSLFLNNASIKK